MLSCCASLALLAATALAEVPVQLPPAEDATAWEEVLRLAGLAPGAAGDGAWVRLEEEGEGWSLTVRDTDGQVSIQAVERPSTYAERRALAFLAASLVEPLDLPPPGPEPSARLEPSARPEPEPPPAEPEEPEERTPPGEASFFYVPSPVLPPGPAVTPVLGAHVGLGLRQGVAPTAQVAVHLGLDLRTPVRLGLVADLTPTAGLTWLEAERGLWTADASAWAWWRGEHLRVGLGFGWGTRRFADRGVQVGHATVPALAGEVVARVRILGPLALEPVARARQDLVGIALLEEREARGELGKTSVLLGLGLGLDLGDR